MTSHDDQDGVAAFLRVRPTLFGMAYRMLGIRADAEDVVQDVFLRWAGADQAGIRDPAAWMMTACTHRSIDILRSVARSRTDYIGSWLPEPLGGEYAHQPQELSYALETAFLMILERATPKERAAFLLNKVFGLSHVEVAEILSVTVDASRKLVSRAGRKIACGENHERMDVDKHRELLLAFQSAILTDDAAEFSKVLAEDVRLVADGGGKASAIIEPLQGRAQVLEYLARARGWWRRYNWIFEALATGYGIALLDGPNVFARIWFETNEYPSISTVYIMRNPEKLYPFSDNGTII
ncbi:MAG: sigma factor [Methylorubrum populi]